MFVTSKQLRDDYSKSKVNDVSALTEKAKKYLEHSIRSRNRYPRNEITVGLFADPLVSSTKVLSAQDSTSPYVTLDYGLLKTQTYSVPAFLKDVIETNLDMFITEELPDKGFTVRSYTGYFTQFQLSENGQTLPSFVPIKYYKIAWSNEE